MPSPGQLLLYLSMVLVGSVVKVEDSMAQDSSATADANATVTLETLLPIHREAAEEYELSIDGRSDRPVRLSPTPISQWTNIRRAGGQLGHVFVWMDGDEPAAMGAIFSFPWGGEILQRRVVHELHALSPTKLTVTRKAAGTVWKPTAGLTRRPLPGVVAEVSNAARFKIQSRQISRQFSGYCVDAEGNRWELRVLPTPLMAYPIDRDDHTGFGAIVGMMGDVGSDLESGCIIEGTKDIKSGKPKWQFAPIRMTDMETHLSFNRKPIWDSVRTQTDTSFYDSEKIYFRFQDKTVAMNDGS